MELSQQLRMNSIQNRQNSAKRSQISSRLADYSDQPAVLRFVFQWRTGRRNGVFKKTRGVGPRVRR
jgi:hypothetical protein